VITNDFPPRKGGIQTFVEQLVSQMYPRSLVVFTSNWPGSQNYDNTIPYDVVRISGKVLLPTPRRIRQAKALIRQYDCDQVLFGALAPLGLMSRSLKRAGVKNIVALTHGHEAGWARIPGLKFLLRMSARHVDVITYLTEYTKNQITELMPSGADLVQLTPAVDTDRFHPLSEPEREELRRKYQLNGKLVLIGISRLMPRKGFDSVIQIMPRLLKDFPNLKFVIAGGGPDQNRLRKLINRNQVGDSVMLLGSIQHELLPAIYNLGNLFAMPCRTRLSGLDVEGFGIVYLEAAACGLAVVAGDSGGAPEAVLSNVTGYVVNHETIYSRLKQLLEDEKLREKFGTAGRNWVAENFTLASRGETIKSLLAKRSEKTQ
jgi:phosphatidylinositol alpha-1,6-mannosyltransferase